MRIFNNLKFQPYKVKLININKKQESLISLWINLTNDYQFLLNTFTYLLDYFIKLNFIYKNHKSL